MNKAIVNRWFNALEIVEVHCQGEIGKVIFSGAAETPGKTALEKMNHINQVDDALRKFVTAEPRASVQMSFNLLVEPSHPDADAAFIVLQADKAHAMSGSNCICVVTALLETGKVKMLEPQTIVKVETPAGLITAVAHCEEGRCVSVTLQNIPCYSETLDYEFDADEWGTLKADIAFGGVFYAIVDVQQIGLTIAPENARLLADAGMKLKTKLNQAVTICHPELPGVEGIAYVMFREWEPNGIVRTCTTLKPGRVDRSPCGTGSSANLATMQARGQIKQGEKQISRSIIGGQFSVEFANQTTIGNKPAVIPKITGSGWIYGIEYLRLDPRDPFQNGFALSDTWGPDVKEFFS
ncbi:proline racemase family protein [Leeia sp. TBRC 13508]|uniref:Proline racemase family protein n=1 Tax=Leeia speluncae TaxID=2884804 RepID=A0ABS8D9Y3_9NEIS|nr:proline racemase family protein [Leeia speluncae]MCB6185011.1 proline racemase family protein [Leeia speluncae]